MGIFECIREFIGGGACSEGHDQDHWDCNDGYHYNADEDWGYHSSDSGSSSEECDSDNYY